VQHVACIQGVQESSSHCSDTNFHPFPVWNCRSHTKISMRALSKSKQRRKQASTTMRRNEVVIGSQILTSDAGMLELNVKQLAVVLNLSRRQQWLVHRMGCSYKHNIDKKEMDLVDGIDSPFYTLRKQVPYALSS
jgi:hypothetical protein